jgi:Protein of unknown function (DUF2795)
MERQSTKHGPRLDDELKHETESLRRGAPVEAHVEEFKEKEAHGEAPAEDPALARRELSRHLDARVFPAERDELLANARAHNAPPEVLSLLEQLPGAKRFETVHDAWEALARVDAARAIEFEARSEGRRRSRG